ncbi:MAG: TPM domain-containing protein [Myxococcota bacterium]|nr:TPM domain-containing protein [Myxococcota bacterium]
MRGLDAAARLHLESVVVEAERETSGEIVVAVARACDEYGSAGWRLGVASAALAYLGLAVFAPPLPAWTYLAAQAVALALGHGLARLDPVRRALLPEALVERRVAERARRCFAERGLTRTQGRTGILLFVALLERRLVVLGDEGIDSVLDPDETWEEVVELAVEGLRSGRPAEGLEAAVRRCGEILRHHVPAPPRNPNELPDAVVFEDENH